jgi:hypothetical protein
MVISRFIQNSPPLGLSVVSNILQFRSFTSLFTMKTAMDGQDRIGLKHFKYEGGRDGAQPGREFY